MLRRKILSIYHQSALYLYLVARQLTRFYCTSFNRPEVPAIPASSLHHVNSLLTYMWDIREEIDMLDVIQEDTKDLQRLYNTLQGLCDYAY